MKEECRSCTHLQKYGFAPRYILYCPKLCFNPELHFTCEHWANRGVSYEEMISRIFPIPRKLY